MALTTTEVNAAYLAVLGRPAEGSAYTWASNFANTTSVAQSILEIKDSDNAAFVKDLYLDLLNRQADAGGLKYWSDRAATLSKVELEKEFIATVVAEGQGVDFEAIKVSPFVLNLYQTLLNRTPDADGLNYWTNALLGSTRAEVIESFSAALAANPDSEDGKTFAAKQTIANDFTTKFNSFSSLITPAEQTKALEAVKATMTSVNAASTSADFAEYIDNFAATYQDTTSQSFTLSPDDRLGVDADGNPNLTSTAAFIGTVNTDDPAKGTIQSTDYATGFANSQDNTSQDNTLTVALTGKADLDLDTMMPYTTSVQKLVINNSALGVKGNLASEVTDLTINGATAAKSDIIGAAALTNVKINSAAGTEITLDASASTNALNYTGAAGNDAVKAAIAGKISLGAGNDTLKINTADKAATIDLGAGDDALSIATSIEKGSSVEINGGVGADTLTLDLDTSVNKGIFWWWTFADSQGDYRGISKISNVEKIVLADATDWEWGKITADAHAIINYDAIKTLTNLEITTAEVDGDKTAGLQIDGGDNNKLVDVSKINVSGLDWLGVDVAKGASVILGTDDTVNFVSLKDDVSAQTITITNFAKTTISVSGDFVELAKSEGTAAVVATDGSGAITLKGYDTAAGYKIENGVFTLNTQDNGAGAEVKIKSIADAKAAVALAAGVDADQVVAVEINNDTYLIDTGAKAADASDDVVIKLAGVTGVTEVTQDTEWMTSNSVLFTVTGA